jgi:hypothetical protein
MKNGKGIRIGSLFMAMLILSMAFVPGVMAQAEMSEKDEYVNTIDITDEVSLSKEETIKLAFRFKSVTLFPLPRNVA